MLLWNLLEQIDTTFMEMYPSVLTAGDRVRFWVFWDVVPCHFVSSSCYFGGSCHLQSVENHPCRDTALTTWKTWILINTTVRTLDARCHNVACPHVACTVQATLCYMHWMVLTHLLVNLGQYTFDFHVFSPLNKYQIWVRLSQERGTVILAEAPGVFSGGGPWTSVSKVCWSQL